MLIYSFNQISYSVFFIIFTSVLMALTYIANHHCSGWKNIFKIINIITLIVLLFSAGFVTDAVKSSKNYYFSREVELVEFETYKGLEITEVDRGLGNLLIGIKNKPLGKSSTFVKFKSKDGILTTAVLEGKPELTIGENYEIRITPVLNNLYEVRVIEDEDLDFVEHLDLNEFDSLDFVD